MARTGRYGLAVWAGAWRLVVLLCGAAALLGASRLWAGGPQAAGGVAVSPVLQQLVAKAHERMMWDEKRFGRALFDKIEAEYQLGNKAFGKPEARKPLEQVLAAYPQSNRAGCACVYLGQMSEGPAAKGYYQRAIARYNDCWWGDGTQVGPAARYLLAHVLREGGQIAEAAKLEKEILTHYPGAVWHDGQPLADKLGK